MARKPSKLRALREELEREEMTLRLQAVKAQKRLYETRQLDYWPSAVRGPWNDEDDGFWLPMGTQSVPWNYSSRKKGELVQVYLSEHGLRNIRDLCRRTASANEFCIAGGDNRVAYVVGDGMKFRMVPRKDIPERYKRLAEKLAIRTQAVVDDFVQANDWDNKQQELVKTCDDDGEAFLRFFPQLDGVTLIRDVEPEHVKTPNGKEDQNEGFGIITHPDDIMTRLGYWIWDDPDAPPQQPTPAKDVLHLKLNTKSNVKRGLPTWWPVLTNLDRANVLQETMTTLVRIRASIALVRKHKNFSKAAVDTAMADNHDTRITNNATGRTDNYSRYRPGTILDAPADSAYEFPSINSSIAEAEISLKCELRSIAARLIMPEWMLTANAADMGAYTSSMVAESPSVKNFKRLQSFYKRYFGVGKYSRRQQTRGVIWRAIDGAIDVGRLPAIVRHLLEVATVAPTVEVRNRAEEATRDQTYVTMGAKSIQRVCEEQEMDYDQTMREIEEHEERMGSSQQLNPLGMPDENGNVQPPKIPQPGQRFHLKKNQPPQDEGGGEGGNPFEHLVEMKDASGHNHDQDGRFSSGGGGTGHKIKVGAKHVKAAAERLGQEVWSKIPQHGQRALAKTWHVAKKVEHKVMIGFHVSKKLAVETAKARGLSVEHAERVGRILAVADLAASWTVNFPAVAALTGSVTAGKVASYVPIASLSYIAYSTVRNPFATIQAAKTVLGKRVKESLLEEMSEGAAGQLLGRMEQYQGNEWWQALLHAALDETQGDVSKAVAIADEAYRRQPEPPDGDEHFTI